MSAGTPRARHEDAEAAEGPRIEEPGGRCAQGEVGLGLDRRVRQASRRTSRRTRSRRGTPPGVVRPSERQPSAAAARSTALKSTWARQVLASDRHVRVGVGALARVGAQGAVAPGGAVELGGRGAVVEDRREAAPEPQPTWQRPSRRSRGGSRRPGRRRGRTPSVARRAARDGLDGSASDVLEGVAVRRPGDVPLQQVPVPLDRHGGRAGRRGTRWPGSRRREGRSSRIVPGRSWRRTPRRPADPGPGRPWPRPARLVRRRRHRAGRSGRPPDRAGSPRRMPRSPRRTPGRRKRLGRSSARHCSSRERAMTAPKIGWSSGAVRKSPVRVGRSSEVA